MEKGLPKSRLQMERELEVTPTSPTRSVPNPPRPARCRKNLAGQFQRLGSEARYRRQNLTDPSTGSQQEGGKCDGQSNEPSLVRHQQGEMDGERKEERGVPSCVGPDLETVSSNKNYSMLSSDRFGQELGEPAPLQAGCVPFISYSRPSDAWWRNLGAVHCLGCNNWGYIHVPQSVTVY